MAEQIRGPIPPDYHYERVVNGRVVETWVPSAQPTLAALNTTRIGDDGVPVAPLFRQSDPMTATSSAPPEASDPASLGAVPESTSSDTAPSWNRSSSKTTESTRQPSQYQTRPQFDLSQDAAAAELGMPAVMPMSAPPADFGGTFDPMENVPPYQNGQMNPRVSGVPLTPGGQWNLPDEGGYDDRRQITQYDTGASAGPFGVQSPRSERPSGSDIYRLQQMRGYNPPGSDGGGGQTRDIISAIRSRVMAKGNAMEAKVRGMADSIGSKMAGGGSAGGGYSSGGYSGSSYDPRQARQDQRAFDRASEAYYEELNNPDPLPVRGWSKRMGYRPGTVEAAVANPDLIIEDALGREIIGSRYDEELMGLPMTDIALATAGTTKRGLTQKTPEVKVPGILKKAGVEPPKIEKADKRILNPSKVVNQMADQYRMITEATPEGGQWFDTDALLGNLAQSHRRSTVRQQFENLFEEDPGAAMQQAENLVANILSTRIASTGNMAAQRYIPSMTAAIGGDILRTRPKRADLALSNLAAAFQR